MAASRVRTLPSMMRSPMRTTAPPRMAGSTRSASWTDSASVKRRTAASTAARASSSERDGGRDFGGGDAARGLEPFGEGFADAVGQRGAALADEQLGEVAGVLLQVGQSAVEQRFLVRRRHAGAGQVGRHGGFAEQFGDVVQVVRPAVVQGAIVGDREDGVGVASGGGVA